MTSNEYDQITVWTGVWCYVGRVDTILLNGAHPNCTNGHPASTAWYASDWDFSDNKIGVVRCGAVQPVSTNPRRGVRPASMDCCSNRISASNAAAPTSHYRASSLVSRIPEYWFNYDPAVYPGELLVCTAIRANVSALIFQYPLNWPPTLSGIIGTLLSSNLDFKASTSTFECATDAPSSLRAVDRSYLLSSPEITCYTGAVFADQARQIAGKGNSRQCLRVTLDASVLRNDQRTVAIAGCVLYAAGILLILLLVSWYFAGRRTEDVVYRRIGALFSTYRDRCW
ncbi:hypothetical protein BDK51DRAFT_49758 [Blyttiomyces helicus]|uniref:Uncharacterized protein n=1 Tax=Blyttiomyces helicus TaxID=388810 RepID=A0A4P9VVK5_9FUNG|nr:hypothetical protein BDK51DRAFT_49758 [Blyttiomyces helicus]|eukprot:RKO83681.1 hypothetical protein BDK51DRAFT_49758 [Blyttiomyces helicus]